MTAEPGHSDLNSAPGDGIPRHVPRQIDEFKLLRRIGDGGMGMVFQAWDQKHLRRVALKVVRPNLVHFAATRERFEREIRSLSRLHHPGIVSVFASGDFKGHRYYVMEFVEGETLAAVLTRAGGIDRSQLRGCDMLAATTTNEETAHQSELTTSWALRSGTWEDACAWVTRDIALAIAHAHDAGVLHRDLKPANIMIDAAGHARLLDFGLARLDDAQTLTHSSLAIGSLAYMPPEQFLGNAKRHDERLDVYGLGLLLYEMLTLTAPFRDAGDPRRVQTMVLSGAAPRPRGLRPSIPARLETICRRAMHRDPTKRTANVRSVVRQLDRFIGQPAPSPWPTRVLAVTTLAFAISSAILAWWLSGTTRGKPASTTAIEQHLAAERSDSFAWIRAAQDALRRGHVREANSILDSMPESLRDWEWHYLRDRARTPDPIIIETGDHPGQLASSPDTVTALVDDRSVVTWDASGLEVGRWDGPLMGTPALTADGRYLVGAPQIAVRQVLVVDCVDSSEKTLDTSEPPQALAWSPDGDRFVTAFASGECAVFDRATLAPLQRWPTGCHGFTPTGVAFSPCGSMVFVGDKQGRAALFDIESRSAHWTRFLGAEVRNVAWHRSGRWLALVVGDRNLLAINATGGIVQADHRDADVRGLVVDSQRDVVWTGDDAGWIDGWIVRSGTRARRSRLEDCEIAAMRFDAARDRLLISAVGGGIWQMESRTANRQFDTGATDRSRALLADPALGVIAVASGSHPIAFDVQAGSIARLDRLPAGFAATVVDAGSVVIAPVSGPSLQRFDLGTHGVTAESAGPRLRVWDLAYRRSRKEIVGACDDSIVRVWDANTLELRAELRGHVGMVARIEVDAAERIVSSGHDGALLYWAHDSGPAVTLFQSQHKLYGLSVDSDADRVFAAETNGILLCIRISTKEILWKQDLHGSVSGLCLNKTNSRLASVDSSSRTIRVWDAATGRSVLDGIALGWTPRRVAYVSSTDQFVTLDEDGLLRLY